MAEPIENPILHILFISLNYISLHYYFIRFKFSTWYQSPKALTSNLILLLPHLKKKTIQKTPHHKSFFFQKMITELNPSLQDRKNPCFPITTTYLTRLHARQKASDSSFTRCRTQRSRSASYSHLFKWLPPSIDRSEADIHKVEKIGTIGVRMRLHALVGVLVVWPTRLTRSHQ